MVSKSVYVVVVSGGVRKERAEGNIPRLSVRRASGDLADAGQSHCAMDIAREL